jgi:hypothetical protein
MAQCQKPTYYRTRDLSFKKANMKTMKRILMVVGAAALLAGCATRDQDDMGGVGNYNGVSYGAGAGSSTEPTMLPPSDTLPLGPNGSVGLGNPLGIGVGSSGLQPAH